MSAASRAELPPTSAHRVHRLYWRIWFAILATVALFAVLAVTAWRLIGERPHPPNITGFAEIAAELLPPATATVEEQRAALERWHRQLGADFALLGPGGADIARTSDDLLPIDPLDPEAKHHVMTPRGPAIQFALPDGRTLLVRRLGRPPPPPGPVLTFALLAVGIGVGAYPVVRRLTRRLERLQRGVTEWGAGNLGARVAVEGRDEVADLAASFNDAAARVERLVDVHRSLLANASHELRSPLARIRMGIELLAEQPTAARRAELARDIAELDQLIDEILMASRLEGGGLAPERAPVDFTGLVAEECARLGATLQAQAVTVEGSARLLQRLVRNLLENAERYGDGTIDVVLREDGAIELDVMDRGPGIAAEERERVFEPFYRVKGASEVHGGVGLGLSLVRQIARQHGGDVRCVPREGGGSCFRVTLPVAAPDSAGSRG
ncbi:MAG TPA: HAMP domain-containing sensor histidine kinase [Burkholderiaceae bacterium]|nr:HAMP domain-containing sensor histidine kinase [Burkholderiaceae bacterium]